MSAKTKESQQLACMFRHQQRVVRQLNAVDAAIDRLTRVSNTGSVPRPWLKLRIKLLRRRVHRIRWHQVKNSERISRFAKQHPQYMDEHGWQLMVELIGDK
ncbi:hypothetical protein [Levilactobacillus yiduensis]|uniref:hypothetical protein n=1 Tax=Levilactobacillus yiduensis TaxID=2953880 RepID=UPI000EF2F226|nr:hypothetical protein [Levilactobacillus yiduensis]AYM03669.1 hypothetical protein D8911_12000 [Levilactobacillus brevis]